MQIFSEAVCWSFGKWYIWQSIFFAAVGPLMLIMSIFMCGSLRCPLDRSSEGKYDTWGRDIVNQPGEKYIENENYGPTPVQQQGNVIRMGQGYPPQENQGMNYPSQYK